MPVFSAISDLKHMIAMENAVDPLEERVFEGANDSIRDSLLDSIEFSILGAENDKTLTAVLAKIPEYNDEDTEIEKELESITESTIFETEYREEEY